MMPMSKSLPEQEPRLPDEALPILRDEDELEVPGVIPSARMIARALHRPIIFVQELRSSGKLPHALHIR
jgi:hypothetical protein